MGILWALIAFIVAITLLIAVHEFGHFWVARLVGVKVLRFSIGFGKALWRWRDKKGTEFVLALLPIGGYVKMVDEREGEVAPQDLPFAFNRQSVWRRMAIIAAGPIFNVLFAIVAYWLMLVIGINSIAPVIGAVAKDSIAAKAGLVPRQEIIQIDGEPTRSWRAVLMALLPHVGSQGKARVVTNHLDGQTQQQHQLDLSHWSFTASKPDLLPTLGITPYIPHVPAMIAWVNPKEIGARGGLKAQDKIIAVNGQPVNRWGEMTQFVRDNPHKTLSFRLIRQGQPMTLAVKVGVRPDSKDKAIGYLGIKSPTVTWPHTLRRREHYGFFAAWPKAVKKTWQITTLTCKMLAKMVLGQVSSKSLSGPIGIAQGAGISAQLGISYFLNFLALVSIGLAIVNILPIPILDGGQFLFCLIELIIRKPVSERVQGAASSVGLFLLLSLMFLTFFNDISRL